MGTDGHTPTPGPWVADEIAPEDPEWGAFEIWAQRENDEPELISANIAGRANAHLIAAAPEMLEALTAILAFDDPHDVLDRTGLYDCIDNHGTPYQSQHLADILTRAKAALTKSTGGHHDE